MPEPSGPAGRPPRSHPGAKRPSDVAGVEPSFDMPERTASYGGAGGKTQPRNRSGGDPKVKIHPQSEGI